MTEQQNLEPDEEIRDIPGYENLYAVTSNGRVWSYPKQWLTRWGSTRYKHGTWLKTNANKINARIVFGLSKDRICSYFHRAKLIALAFIPNPDNKPIVGHKNGDLFDDRVSNLYWTTKSELEHHYLHALKKSIGANLPQTVAASTGEIFPSTRDAAKWCNLKSATTIRKYLTKTKAKGYCYKSAGKHPITKEPLTWKYHYD